MKCISRFTSVSRVAFDHFGSFRLSFTTEGMSLWSRCVYVCEQTLTIVHFGGKMLRREMRLCVRTCSFSRSKCVRCYFPFCVNTQESLQGAEKRANARLAFACGIATDRLTAKYNSARWIRVTTSRATAERSVGKSRARAERLVWSITRQLQAYNLI